MNALVELKSISASPDQAIAKAWQLFPGDSPSQKSNRSLFMRVFRAPQTAYDQAVHRWKQEDANFTEIADGVPRVSAAGPRVGNMNATAQNTKHTALKRCSSHWRSLSEIDKATFMIENGLVYSPNCQPAPNTIQDAINAKLYQLLHSDPFQPFDLITNDGKEYYIATRNHVSLSPTRHRAIVWLDDGGSITILTSQIRLFEE